MASRPTVQHRLEYALVRAARGVDRVVGRRRSDAFAGWLGKLAYRPLGIRADLVEQHVQRAFPEQDEAWVQRVARTSYAHLGREAMSMLRLSRLGAEEVRAVTDVDDGLGELRAAVESDTGAVMVTGHFGNWEIGGAALAARGIPLDVVAQRQANPLVDRLLNSARERLGMRVIRRGNATKESLRSLRAGRVVALVADQDARGAGIFVPFLGRPASTYRGPAVLALRSGAPLFIGTAVRFGHRYRVRVRRVPLPEEAAPADQDHQVRALTLEHVRALEAEVRAEPGQYFWHHRRWKTAPPGGGVGGSGSGNGQGAATV